MNEPMFQIEKIEGDKNYAKFVISPLERGYGNTMGNSLRRVLLQSLGGAAIVNARISGVKHQFSTLKGMKEDVVEFLLNLKQVRISYDKFSDEKEKGKISVTGPGEVKAKDIKLPGNLTVVNPEHVLAYLEKGAKLEVEVEIGFGYGYVTADEQESGKIGVIPMDAIYTPIHRVNYSIEETRVGRLTNYDKLILEITTDGTVDPKDALVKASEILIAYFKQVVAPKKVEKAVVQEEDLLGPTGKLSVEEIGLPTRVANALAKSGYETVSELVNAKKQDLIKVRNLGEKSLKIVTVALAEKGVKFPQE